MTRAQTGDLGAGDAEATFTVSNLGMFGVEAFVPLLNPPQVAILGIGHVADEPAVVRGELVVRPACVLSLTFDHRANDGAAAARFLGALRDGLASTDAAATG